MQVHELPPSKNTKPRTSFPSSLAFTYTLDGTVQKAMNFTGSLTIPECSVTDFQYWSLAPILENGWALLGELNKILPISETRFVDLTIESRDSYVVYLTGVPGERIPLTVYDTHTEKAVVYDCTISSSGGSVLYLPSGVCNKN